MRRLFALYQNEMAKIFRRVSVVVILSLTVVAIALCGVLVKFEETARSNSMQYSKANEENLKTELAKAQSDLKNVQTKLSETSSEIEKRQLQREEYIAKANIDRLQFAIDNNIDAYSDSSYRSLALNTIMSLKTSLYDLKSIPQPAQADKDNISLYEKIIPEYESAVKNSDFKAYISAEKERIKGQSDKSEDEKKIALESLDLREKLTPNGEEDNYQMYLNSSSYRIQQIENYKYSLLYNLDYSNNQKPLTLKSRQDIENKLTVAVYKAEHNIKSTTAGDSTDLSDTGITGMLGLGTFMVILLMLILAGSSVSSEISTGSIKSLIISPTKRWKIFTAKIAALFTMCILSTLLVYLLSILVYGIIWGFGSGTPYVYATAGSAHEINFYLYRFLYLFVDIVQVIVYTVFAFMLSVITRNTAVSVGISIAIYFGGNIANSILLSFAHGDWLKFIPFNNISITDRVFPTEMTQIMSNTSVANLTVTFSLCYIAVILICMTYSALDSFKRRDIK